MSSEEEFRVAYLDECVELLQEAETGLTALEGGDRSRETIDAVFRAVHSIKGGAGMFGLEELVRFSHGFETVLDCLRGGELAVDAPLLKLLLRAADTLSAYVEAIRGDLPLPLEHGDAVGKELAALTEASVGTVDEEGDGFGFFADEAATEDDEGFGFFDDEPAATDNDDEGFGFFDDEPAATDNDDEQGWGLFASETADVVPDPPPKSAAARPRVSTGTQSIRVDLGKVDSLVDQVGELVITQAVLRQQAADLPVEPFAGLIQALEELAMQTRELQESVMAVRAQPVKSVFSRMPRLVRELAQSLGKEARLVTCGEDTEVDKTVIEELADPLTHMLRNSMDHGLETPEERIAAGKPARGTVHLSAEHRSGRILITVSDDGRGIDRSQVLSKARERDLLPADVTPSDEEIDQLIFHPGFSTAAAVSDVSGRGVGMDVVKRKIQDLGGRITIASEPGQGTRFTLALPLTLAVLDGMIVRVGNERYVVPITAIVESLRPRPEDVSDLPQGGTVLRMRGDYIPLLRLDRLFGVAGAQADPCQALVLIAETEDGSPLGIIVDDLLGQQQVVIKSLETNYRRVEGVSGATILGNGLVALILDVDALRGLSRQASAVPARSLVLEQSEVH